jgi:hypothetical protein
MAKGSATRKQLLKEPDQFITFSGKLIAFGRSNLKTYSDQFGDPFCTAAGPRDGADKFPTGMKTGPLNWLKKPWPSIQPHFRTQI